MQTCEETDCRAALNPPEAVLDRNTPLVLRGLFNHWPVVQAAQHSNQQVMDYIANLATDEPVVVYQPDASAAGRVFFNNDYTGYNFTRYRVPIKAVIDELKAGLKRDNAASIYVGSTMVTRWLPDFVAANPCQLADKNPIISLWMGNRSRIAAHFDCPGNLAVCIAGKRRFDVFPPEQLANLYIGSLDETPAGRPVSLVDFEQPDNQKFPAFKQALAAGFTAELAPGDALLLPPLWWHHVRSTAPFNALINYWWVDWPQHKGNPEMAFEMALLTIRGLPERQRQAWKNFFDHYIFADAAQATKHIPKQLQGVLDTTNAQAHRQLWQALKNKLHHK